jgi:hypothetical protein
MYLNVGNFLESLQDIPLAEANKPSNTASG